MTIDAKVGRFDCCPKCGETFHIHMSFIPAKKAFLWLRAVPARLLCVCGWCGYTEERLPLDHKGTP